MSKLFSVGDRVRNRWQGYEGVVLEVEEGCNGGYRVRFDGREFDSVLPKSDFVLAAGRAEGQQ